LVVLNNPGNAQFIVNPVLYNLNGKPLAVRPVQVGPRQQLRFDISDWIAESGSDDTFKQGNLILSYDAPDSVMLGAQVTITNAKLRLSFDARDEMPMSFKSSRLEGIWWQPDQASRYDLVLSNMEDSVVSVSISPSGEPSTLDNAGLSIKLAPHETRVLDLTDKTMPSAKRVKANKAAGLSISHSAAPGAVLAYGMLSKNRKGFSSQFTFEDPATRSSQTLAATHMLIGKPDLPGFPAGTSFTSKAIIRNAGDEPINVIPKVSFISHHNPTTVSLETRELRAQQVEVLDVGAELKRAGFRGPFAGAGMTLDSTGKPGSLIAHVMSFDGAGNQVFNVPVKDIGVSMNRLSGSHPWTLEGDTRSLIHVRNTTDETARFTIQLDYDGGSYALPMQELEPQQEVAVDVGQLRNSQTKDSIGRVIPKDVMSGQATWIEHGPQALIGRAEVFSVKNAVASSFSCPVGCCPAGDNRTFVFPSGFMKGVPGDTGLMQLMLIRRQDCNGQEFGPFNVTSSSTWSSSDSSIVTLGAPTSNGCLMTCMSGGQATVHIDFEGVCVQVDPFTDNCEQLSCMLPADCDVFVQIPSKVRFVDTPPRAPDGKGPVIEINDGDVRDTAGNVVKQHQCGVYRNLAYELVDQVGEPITDAFTVAESFDNYQGPDSAPDAVTVNILAGHIIGDTQYFGRAFPACLGSNDHQSFKQHFSVTINGMSYNLSTVVTISEGKFSGTAKVDVDITTP